MRIDKFLKVSRLIKRRTVADAACTAGRVKVNGNVAKSSVKVIPGDEIEIRFGENVRTIKVLSLKESTRKEEAEYMYEEII